MKWITAACLTIAITAYAGAALGAMLWKTMGVPPLPAVLLGMLLALVYWEELRYEMTRDEDADA